MNTHRFEVYQRVDGRWSWRLRAANWHVVADGSEGYATKSNARRAVRAVVAAVAKAEIR